MGLTDMKLKNLKPQEKAYKVLDRDGMYGVVSPKGTVTFRYDYRLAGRRETLSFSANLTETKKPVVVEKEDAAPVAAEERKASEEEPGGLQWAESDNGSLIGWNEATQYCASKGSGWRLPTVAELQNSYKSGHSIPCGDYSYSICQFASNSRLTGNFIWANSFHGSSSPWPRGVDIGAARSDDPYVLGDIHRALCVRRP